MYLSRLYTRRILLGTSKYLFRDINTTSAHSNHIVATTYQTRAYRAMAQRIITSFFKVSPPKTATFAAEKKEDTSVEGDVKDTSPIRTEKRLSKRARLDSSGSEAEAKTTKLSPTVNSDKKKKSKRQRIESSDSECEPSQSKPSSPKEKLTIKVEKTDSPKTYASPKIKKGKNNLLKEVKKSPVTNKNTTKDVQLFSKTKKAASKDSPNGKKSPEISLSPKKIKKEVIGNKTALEEKENIVKNETENDEEVVPVAETEYNPAKPKYHPVKDACWRRGAAVPYLALSRTFEAIEPTSARLKIIEILSNYFRSVMVLTPEDLLPSVYMCLNQLAPAYHSLELGIAETYLMKAVGACTGRTLAQLRGAAARGGDLGAVAEQARAAQRTMFPQPPLTLRKVFAALKDIANMTGQASVNKKIAKIQSLYVACRHSEARYLIRSLEGKLRIGLAEQSVLQALALASASTGTGTGARVLDASEGLSHEQFKARVDEHSILIKTTYCECPNYDAIIPALLAHGAAELPRRCPMAVGVPLKPMLAHPTKGVHEVFNRFEGEQFTCEWKYDGERAQIHVPGCGDGDGAGPEAPDLTRAAIFSRNQENNTSKYPDVLRRLPALLKQSVSSCVLDCEAVAYDTETKQILPFQILSTRKRKDASEADIKVQVCVFVFDLLFLNGRPLVREPLATRRELLTENFNQVEGEWQFATSKDCKDMEEVQLFLDEAVRGSCEGLMVKTLQGEHAKYDIARRSHNWLKLKKDYLDGVGDTIDVVIIGAYAGRGKRRAGYGGFLAACRDPDTDCYQSLCKLGTGFSDEDLTNFTEMLKSHEIPQPRSYYTFDSSHAPDAWFEAACVWEVRCADLSLSPAHRAAIGRVDPDKGISLRFPRFVRVREDKTPEQATSAQQIAEMYLAQDQVKNTAATAKNNYNIDDFY